MKLISNSTINRFIMKKFPKRIVGTDSAWAVLYLYREDLMQKYKIIKSICESFFGWKFFGFKIVENQTKILVSIGREKPIDVDKYEVYKKFMEEVIKVVFQKFYNVIFCDYRMVYLESQILNEEFEKISINVVKTEQKHVFYPMKKADRARLNTIVAQFEHIKAKTVGQYSNKRIVLSYKR